MSAHRTLNDLFRAFDLTGPGRLPDPGDTGTITVSQWGQICSVVTTGAQTRTLAAPTKPGVMAVVVLDERGGDLTLTVTGGYNQLGTTTIVFDTAGDWVAFVSVKVGANYRWRIVAQEGTGAYETNANLLSAVITALEATTLSATTVGGSSMWTGAPSPADPSYESLVHQYFNDFVMLTRDYDATNDWTMTEVHGGETQAIRADVVGGTLLLTNNATTDNSGCQIHFKQEQFKFAANKTLWFEARIKAAARKVGANSEIDIIVGLWKDEDLKAVADNMAADGAHFHVDDETKVWKFTASKGGTHTGTLTTAVDLSADWVTLGFKVNGVTSIVPYINGVAQTAVTATMQDTEELAIGFMVRNGDAAITQTLEIDYVRCVQLR
jgi:hypothetical protein